MRFRANIIRRNIVLIQVWGTLRILHRVPKLRMVSKKNSSTSCRPDDPLCFRRIEVYTAVPLKDKAPCSPLELKQRFGGTCRLSVQLRRISSILISCLTYSLTMNIEAICSSKTSFYFQQNTRRYIPVHRSLHEPG
jgi:hypothetical protein